MKRLAYIGNHILLKEGDAYHYRVEEWNNLRSIASLFDAIDIYVGVLRPSDMTEADAISMRNELNIPNATIYNTTAVSDSGGREHNLFRRQLIIKQKLTKAAKDWDFVFLVGPSWSIREAWLLCRQLQIPYAVNYRAVWVDLAREGRLARMPWFRPFRSIYLNYVRQLERNIMYGAAIRMTVGYCLLGDYPDIRDTIIPTVSTELPLAQFRRREPTCEGPRIRILCVGIMTGRKGQDIAIRALVKLREMGVAAQLELIGGGPREAELKALAKELDAESHIIFHGYQKNDYVLTLMQEVDIYLLPSNSEGFPRTVHEAFSQSLPVVVTRVGGVPNILVDKEHAMLIPPGDVDATAEALRVVIKDNELRARIMRNGHDFSYQFFKDKPFQQVYDAFAAQVAKLPSS